MPDWKQLVRKHLPILAVCLPELAEELAGHLEDSYDAFLREGLTAEAAFQHTIGQIEGRCWVWLVMRSLQEEFMTGFITKVVLPGVLTFAAAGLFYWTLAVSHIRPEVIWLVGGQLPLWWWCLLPICGVLGGLLSQRNGGSRLQRMAASLVPSAILCTLVLMIFAVGFTMSGYVNHHQLVAARLEGLGIVPPGFGLIPAVFSLLGVGIAEVINKFHRLA
jgi:hypothetical protein